MNTDDGQAPDGIVPTAGRAFTLERNPHGRLVLRMEEGCWENVVPVRAFPIQAPDDGIALMSADGHERVWIDRLADLPEATRRLIEAELAVREFTPVIQRLIAISGFTTPSTWQVETDRGRTGFVLKGEEFIRRLTPTRLLITDAQGVHYLVPDLNGLDRGSRRMVDRFL
ncbi:MAG: DUF1854 domain-containing protein [Burkholderiaceae bacterium]